MLPMPLFAQRRLHGLIIVLSLSLVGGCDSSNRLDEPASVKPTTASYPVDPDIAKRTGNPYQTLKDSQGVLLGDLAIGVPVPALFGDEDNLDPVDHELGDSDTVNSFLWRAALDTVVFMPVEVADKQSGVIRTDWYEDRERPNERFKLNVFIVSDRLSMDGVQVGVFREERKSFDQGWEQAAVAPEKAEDLRTIIADRALELRDGTAK